MGSPSTTKQVSYARYAALPADLAVVMLSFYLSGSVLHESLIPHRWSGFEGYPKFLLISSLLLLIKGSLFVSLGLYRSLLSYGSLHDIVHLFKNTSAASLIFSSAILFANASFVSLGMLVMDWLLLSLLMNLRSFGAGVFRETGLFQSGKGKKTVIIGAGAAGNRLAGELRTKGAYGLTPIGFLDDDPKKIGRTMQGLPVMGRVEDLERFMDEIRIEEVVIAADLPGPSMRGVYQRCEGRRIPCKTLPHMIDLLSRRPIGKAIRDINIEDLLGRKTVAFETDEVRRALAAKKILVTGAGGSIGSEVARQLFRCAPASIVLFDQAETPLYEIDYELRRLQTDKGVIIRTIMGDIRDADKIVRAISDHGIDTVFHCAAYKHVPLLENNSREAIVNNVQGTINVADAADLMKVERFVMISTDKAVNPVNIMGATKRIAEMYVQNLARESSTKFITVRFGNVLGSNGSVIPLFKKQIECGGPVTVTHPDIIRYFMTIPEASGLIILAGIMGQEGEIFILDMGSPVRIRDLAEDMIRLSGLVPGEDIEIRYTGIRPGEKLYEELLCAGEGIRATRHEKIYIAMSKNQDVRILRAKIDELIRSSQTVSRERIDELIREIVPEYMPGKS